MSGGQYLGYHFYSAGVSPKELRVGNVVWNYKQPTRYAPYQQGIDLASREDFFEPKPWSPFTVNFADKQGFAAQVGVVNLAWLHGQWGSDHNTRISAEEAREYHVLSGRESAFLDAVLEAPEASEWLRRNLSGAFTAASYCHRLLRRPKLWLCTGLVTIDKGTYTVTYEGVKTGKASISDPSNTIPVGLQVSSTATPSSAIELGISQKTIIGAQWMLLYCVNKKSTEDKPTSQLGPHSVTLTTKFANGNVKGADSTSAIIHTNQTRIDSAERGGVKLYVYRDKESSDDDEGDERPVDTQRPSADNLFEPMFPEENAEEYEMFLKAMEVL